MQPTTDADRNASHLTPRLRAILAVVLIADASISWTRRSRTSPPPPSPATSGAARARQVARRLIALPSGCSSSSAAGSATATAAAHLLVGIAGFGSLRPCAGSRRPRYADPRPHLQGAFGALLIPQGIGSSSPTSPAPSCRGRPAPSALPGRGDLAGPILAGFLIGANMWASLATVFLINIVLGEPGCVASSPVHPRRTNPSPMAHRRLGSGCSPPACSASSSASSGSTAGWTAHHGRCWAASSSSALRRRQPPGSNPLIRVAAEQPGLHGGPACRPRLLRRRQRFAYVISLVLPTGTRLQSLAGAALGSPVMVGIVASSFIARPLIPYLGRRLVVVAWRHLPRHVRHLVTGFARASRSPVALAPSVLVLGPAWAHVSATIYEVALGEVTRGSRKRSGSLSPPCNSSRRHRIRPRHNHLLQRGRYPRAVARIPRNARRHLRCPPDLPRVRTTPPTQRPRAARRVTPDADSRRIYPVDGTALTSHRPD